MGNKWGGKFCSLFFIINLIYNILITLKLYGIVEAVSWEIILSNLCFIDEEIKAERS